MGNLASGLCGDSSLAPSDDANRKAALKAMLAVEGFDVVIVCTGTPHQAAFWQARLERGKGTVVPKATTVLCVDEDWDGGAGNGLGTLYAWRKALALAEERGDYSLAARLAAGSCAAALYHTAGKGTRLAPLPGAENNNKPGVKLPCTAALGEGGAATPMTILESVVKQTGVYAKSRKGRLSVFWGDQVFVPTRPTAYDAPRAHADILCMLAPMPDAEAWAAKGLEKYGLVVVAENGGAAQIEKVDHATAVAMTGSLGAIASVGTSLGSFSVTAALLNALLAEFAPELDAKAGQLDSDPHWWMPLTLPADAYGTLMAKKGVSEADSAEHYARMQALKASFDAQGAHILGPVDVGGAAYWWDYGQLKLYLRNALRLAEDDVEASAMRAFLGVERKASSGPCAVDAASAVVACDLKRGSVRKSVLAHVACADVDADGAVLVNVTAKKVVAKAGAVAYNVVDDSECLTLEAGDVATDVFMEDGRVYRQKSALAHDGGKVWKTAVCGNAYSFEDVYKKNLATNVIEASKLAAAAHAKLGAGL